MTTEKFNAKICKRITDEAKQDRLDSVIENIEKMIGITAQKGVIYSIKIDIHFVGSIYEYMKSYNQEHTIDEYDINNPQVPQSYFITISHGDLNYIISYLKEEGFDVTMYTDNIMLIEW